MIDLITDAAALVALVFLLTFPWNIILAFCAWVVVRLTRRPQ